MFSFFYSCFHTFSWFHICFLFSAGTETTRQTLAWIWLYFAAFPEIQKKAQDEIDEVLGDNKITVSCRDDLHYVDAVLHEVMRIKPVAPTGVPREVAKTTKLSKYLVMLGFLTPFY